MKETTKEKMDSWLSHYPESSHPLDEERKFNFVKSLCDENDSFTYDDLLNSFCNSHSDYTEDYCKKLCEEWEVEVGELQRFGHFLRHHCSH